MQADSVKENWKGQPKGRNKTRNGSYNSSLPPAALCQKIFQEGGGDKVCSVKRQSKMKCEKRPLDFGIMKSLTPEYAFVFFFVVLLCLFFNDGYGRQNGQAKEQKEGEDVKTVQAGSLRFFKGRSERSVVCKASRIKGGQKIMFNLHRKVLIGR